MNTPLEQQQKLYMARKKVKALKGFYTHLIIYLIVNTGLITAKALTVENSDDFFNFNETFSTAFFWGLGLLFHGLAVFNKHVFMGSNWEERKIREIMQKEQQSKTKWE